MKVPTEIGRRNIILLFIFALGGIVLTASHNPGGIDNDFGIKFNCANGGPAPDQTTDEIYNLTTKITEYKIVPDLECPIDKLGEYSFDVSFPLFLQDVFAILILNIQRISRIFQ